MDVDEFSNEMENHFGFWIHVRRNDVFNQVYGILEKARVYLNKGKI